MGALTRAADAIAEVVAENCSASPDGDWSDCCRSHDRRYEHGFRWRLDRKFTADVRLGWCIATRPGRGLLYRAGHVAVGLVYTAVTLTLGLWWWFRCEPVASKAKRWGERRVRAAKGRQATERAIWARRV